MSLIVLGITGHTKGHLVTHFQRQGRLAKVNNDMTIFIMNTHMNIVFFILMSSRKGKNLGIFLYCIVFSYQNAILLVITSSIT